LPFVAGEEGHQPSAKIDCDAIGDRRKRRRTHIDHQLSRVQFADREVGNLECGGHCGDGRCHTPPQTTAVAE
jgi:hypothetical protein